MELDRQKSEETKSTVMLFQLTVPQQGCQCSLNPKGGSSSTSLNPRERESFSQI